MEALQKLLDDCHRASRETQLMSRQHCHAKNVSSIVVANTNGRLTRAFLAWPGHELGDNNPSGHLAVGIHNHRYDLDLKLITGRVHNTVYEMGGAGFRLYRWHFQSGEMSGPPTFALIGEETVSQVTRVALSPVWLHLPANLLHDIECSTCAAWYVREGETRQQETLLFTSKPSVSVSGLYLPFRDHKDVLDHVARFVDVAENDAAFRRDFSKALHQDRLLSHSEWRDGAMA